MRQEQTDTDDAIEARRIDGFRHMTPAQKFALTGALTRNVRQLALAGIRLRHPGIDAREAQLRLAAMTIDKATMVRAFGWDPERGEPNVFLIGQAGVGKTSLGKIVAERLKRHFFDLDEEVERFHHKNLDELRRDFLGGHSYRAAKIDVLLSFSKDARNAVIAVSSDCARERRVWKLMREKGVTIHLYADPIEVNERCPIYVGGRELSAEEKKGMHKRLAREAKSLFNYHRPFYERANHTLDITGLGIEAAAQRLCDLISRVARERREEQDAAQVP